MATVVSSLIELAYKQPGDTIFTSASSIQGSTEDMLDDGAIDQTFAFQRLSHIQLHYSKIEMADALETQVPNPEKYFLEQMSSFLGSQNKSIQELLVGPKAANLLSIVCKKEGVNIQ